MYRLTFEELDEQGAVVSKRVWDVPPEGKVSFTESCPVSYDFAVGSYTPYGITRGPTTLQISAILDPHTHWEPFNKTGSESP